MISCRDSRSVISVRRASVHPTYPKNAGSVVQLDPLRYNQKLANRARRAMRHSNFKLGMAGIERLTHLCAYQGMVLRYDVVQRVRAGQLLSRPAGHVRQIGIEANIHSIRIQDEEYARQGVNHRSRKISLAPQCIFCGFTVRNILDRAAYAQRLAVTAVKILPSLLDEAECAVGTNDALVQSARDAIF